MINAQEMELILNRLQSESGEELSREMLEQMLSEELARPEEEIDTELVQQLLELLEEPPAPGAQEQAWDRLRQRLSARHAFLRRTVQTLLALVAAVSVFLLGLHTAEAYNKRLLERHAQPESGTFTVSTQPGSVTPGISQRNIAIRSQVYIRLEDTPQELLGYPVRPIGLPERFTYQESRLYEDSLIATISHLFTSEEGLCIFSVHILANPSAITISYYEKNPGEMHEKYICGVPVLFYTNTTAYTPCAAWIVNGAEYILQGPMSEAEMTAIIEATMLNTHEEVQP